MLSLLMAVQQQVVASSRSEDDVMMAGLALICIVAIGLGARFSKKKQSGLAALLFVACRRCWCSRSPPGPERSLAS